MLLSNDLMKRIICDPTSAAPASSTCGKEHPPVACHHVLLAVLQVLAVYPTTIRRRILRQLYSAPLKECYLFQHCGVKFLDALMLGARVELFLPKVCTASLLLGRSEMLCKLRAACALAIPDLYSTWHYMSWFVLLSVWGDSKCWR